MTGADGKPCTEQTRELPQRASSLTFIVDHQTALVLKYLRDSQAAIDVAVRSRAEDRDASTRSVQNSISRTGLWFSCWW